MGRSDREVPQHARPAGGGEVGFREAIFTGLAPDGGLYQPLEWPDLGGLFGSFGPATEFPVLAARTLHRLLAPELSEEQAGRIARRAFPFSPLLRSLDGEVALLELFHGPTCAFKDFGACFLAARWTNISRRRGGGR